MRYLALWISLLICSPALAGVRLEVDKEVGFIGEQFTVQVIVDGQNAREPEFPAVNGATVRRGPTGTFHRSINGVETVYQTYQYSIIPFVEGDIVIGPVRVSVNGEMIESEGLTIRVEKPSEVAGAPEVFIERDLEPTKAYVGQQIRQIVRVYVRVNWREPRIDHGLADDFEYRAIDEQRQKQVIRHGHRYQMVELAGVIIPNKAGKYTLMPFGVQANFADESGSRGQRQLDPFGFPDFFSRNRYVTKAFQSPPAEIEVMPLPSSPLRNRWSGVVGDFVLEATLPDGPVEVGESINVQLEVTGYGSLDTLNEIPLREGGGFKVYADRGQLDSSLSAEAGIYSRFHQTYAVVPAEPGTINFGKVELVVFSVSENDFVTLSADLGTLEVTGAAPSLGVDLPAPVQDEGEVMEHQGFAAYHRSKNFLRAHNVRTSDYYMAGALMFAGVMLLTGSGLMRLRGARSEGARRQRHLAAAAVHECVKRCRGKDLQDPVFELGKALRIYLGQRFSTQGGALTSREIIKLVSVSAIDESVVEELQSFLDFEESSAYASQQASASQIMRSCDQITKVVDALEASAPKGVSHED